MQTLTLTVPDMACAACAETITKAVQAIDTKASVQANPDTKAVIINSANDPNAITQAITDAGYTVEQA
ncbi:Copper chaperone [Halomicronema hongdechloris C2206]|uniref:Copper chaperone n=1 Tax=Halomicronema hongdechloris C2206 TaxID=1641165 RepID=A0A1Z3HMZ2_9CYAN|nr:heavy-metal-associated domain-containing protein [Halomicronema hongdechloris]ASC71684.1 Copper chaperone [Halomicronema hongdechloris C2206]